MRFLGHKKNDKYIIMNIDVITLNECRNNGAHVYLYPNKEIAAWTAYGRSAYTLHFVAKANGYNDLTGFSETIQMPCTSVGEEVIEFLAQNKIFASEGGGNLQPHITRYE